MEKDVFYHNLDDIPIKDAKFKDRMDINQLGKIQNLTLFEQNYS